MALGRPWRFAAACLFVRWGAVVAWSVEGHERIGRIAQGLLFGKHRDQIRTLMHSDVIDISDWEKTMTSKFPETDRLHWHHQDPEWTCDDRGGLGDKGGHVRCDGAGAESGSLFCALAYFFEHFAHDALLNEFPKPKEPIGTPTSLKVLDKIPSSEQKPANFLRWLVILVGDLHQPLHWLRQYGYGADVIVRYKGHESTLLKFWEEYIPRNLQNMKATNHPDQTEYEYGTRKTAWEHKLPTELFRDWAKETAEQLCTEVYKPMTVNHADGTRVESPFELTDELYNKWAKIAEGLLALSGERLAFVLNEIIEHRRHKEAHDQGRGLPSRKVAVGTQKVGGGAAAAPSTTAMTSGGFADRAPAPSFEGIDENMLYRQLVIEDRRQSWSNFVYNASIAAIVVPLLLIGFSFHEKNGAQFRIREHLKM
uniref:S1/P1 nuclease n=1 Tax=Alexandrium catenella TaxID=2925 RepID=A0A7S1L8F7_ALECA|eukprot:CAMPEP_0171207888 /NCGR_PEP_ID=MMETSP0790-20130122/27806_1 /TAXON_ID=2925 /ORGANISM="Alexandrium catenella, Strain OF101" /LENGTH=423 /DNA_ID=CAMNT_0011673469 /DNA_START=26 /DNA_END=1297 /DNA_ORIENTATION=+